MTKLFFIVFLRDENIGAPLAAPRQGRLRVTNGKLKTRFCRITARRLGGGNCNRFFDYLWLSTFASKDG
jgi:hypothetical protein